MGLPPTITLASRMALSSVDYRRNQFKTKLTLSRQTYLLFRNQNYFRFQNNTTGLVKTIILVRRRTQ